MQSSEPQKAWFVQVNMEDVFHTHVLLLQCNFEEAIKRVHYLSRRTGAVCIVHALEKQPVAPQADHLFKCMAEEGMLLKEVARVTYDFASWRTHFSTALEELPQEQRLAELANMQSWITKEEAAIRLLPSFQKEPKCQGLTSTTTTEASPSPAATAASPHDCNSIVEHSNDGKAESSSNEPSLTSQPTTVS